MASNEDKLTPSDEDFIYKKCEEYFKENPIIYHGNLVTVKSNGIVFMTNADFFNQKMQEAAKTMIANLGKDGV